jgi:cell division protein ZapA
MAQVQISINNQTYTITCDDGQEERLKELASFFDSHVQSLASKVGRIADSRLMLLAGLTICDELREAEARLRDVEAERGVTSEDGAARVIEAAADKIREVAGRM